MAPRRIDDVTRVTPTDEDVQPSRTAPDTPTRFVGRDLRRATQVFAKLLVGRSATLGRARDRTNAGGSRDVQLREQRAQQPNALAVRQAQLFVENRQQGMDLRAQLTGRGATGRRCLQIMPASYGVAAVFARANMHVESSIDHRPWNLSLILGGDVGLAQAPSVAVRARLRQRHVVGLVDPRRHTAMGMPTMTFARLAPRLLRLGRRFVLLAKGRGLAFTFTAQCFDEAQQLLHVAFELRDSLVGDPQLLAESSIVVDQFLIRRMAQYAAAGFRFRRVHTRSTTRITLAAHSVPIVPVRTVTNY